MQEINARLVKQRITNSNINISPNLAKSFEVNMEMQVNAKRSANHDEKKIMLSIDMKIATKDEALKIEFTADVIFELDGIPADYGEITEQTLIPMARDSVLNVLDEMLVVMGYSKMELVKKCNAG